jgi:hypothetical protein
MTERRSQPVAGEESSSNDRRSQTPQALPTPQAERSDTEREYESVIPPANKLWMLDKLARSRGFRNTTEALASLPLAGKDPAWMVAFDEAREAILHDRHALAEEGMTNDQTNAVLSILDDAFMPHLRRTTAPATSEGASNG